MAIEKKYSCDLCRDKLEIDGSDGKRAIGIHWSDWPKGWKGVPARQSERHLCISCVCSIQAMPKICGQGYQCTSGPACQSDHK